MYLSEPTFSKCLMHNVPKFYIGKNNHLMFKILQCSNVADYEKFIDMILNPKLK